ATEAKNQLSISLLELIQLMELEGDGAFDIDSLDEDIVVMNELNPAAMYDAALECMPQIRQAYYRLKSKSKEVKIAKSGYYPTLSIGAGIATGYYYTERGLSDPFKYQFDNNMQKSIYMTLTIPLFDRFNTRNQARGARINENSAMLSLEGERKKLYKEIEKAYTDVLGSFEKYKATSRAVKANEEAHRYALEKYAAGKSTPFEYNEIKMKLADALSKQSQAKYAYLLRSRILSFYSCHSLVN
ncbi:MAG: TolC family protein, partial [Phocaeicola sp.]